MEKSRILTLDIHRIIAVLSVIMIHISAGFVINYDKASEEFLAGNIFDSISRMGVPLFIMVSGALMLDEAKEITFKNQIFKKIKNVITLIILWAFFYAMVYQVLLPVLDGDIPNLRMFILAIIDGHYHMWFLYMIIGLYLITPFVRCIAQKENKKLVLAFIILSLLTQFSVPILEGLTLIWGQCHRIILFMSKLELHFFCGYITYYLTGWYIMHNDINRKVQRYIIYPASALALIATILYVHLTQDYNNAYSNMNIFVYIYSVGVFSAIKNIPVEKYGKKMKTLIVALSNLSFGVYIVHDIPLFLFNRNMSYHDAPLLYLIIQFLGISIVSFVGCYILSKIPLVKKTVRM